MVWIRWNSTYCTHVSGAFETGALGKAGAVSGPIQRAGPMVGAGLLVFVQVFPEPLLEYAVEFALGEVPVVIHKPESKPD